PETIPLVPAPRTELLPLSFAQERLWFIDQLLPGSASYNIPLAYRLSGPLNVGALLTSIREVVRRHEVLRTTFPVVGHRPIQQISTPESFDLAVIDLGHLAAGDRDAEASCLADTEAH